MTHRRSYRWAILVALLLACCWMAQGCATPPGGDTSAGDTDVAPVGAGALDPDAPDIVPNADDALMETQTVALYYRMRGEALLACETRTLSMPKDKLTEHAIIEALIGGPSPGLLDLTGLFSMSTRVARVAPSGSLLTVTFSHEFLDPPANAPADWESDASWRAEVLTRRQLALASVVNTITEATPYTAIQFLVLDEDDEVTGRRILRSEIYENSSSEQLLAPLLRSEKSLLTHYNTATLLLDCWKGQTFDRLYRFLATEGHWRPTEAEFLREMEEMNRPLLSYAVSAGLVTESGHEAVLEASYECMRDGSGAQVRGYPLHLVREGGLWKITYAEFMRMLEAV